MEEKDFVQSLERGLAVLQAFSQQQPAMTLADVARATGLSRPTARRLLLTLEQLGYVQLDSRHFPLTPRTLTERAALKAEIAQAREQGWALVDQELELGLRSIAAPLRNRPGCVVAALNVSAHASRVDLRRLKDEFLSALLDSAGRITKALAARF